MHWPSARILAISMLAVVASFSVAVWVPEGSLDRVDAETRVLETDVTPTLRGLGAIRSALKAINDAAWAVSTTGSGRDAEEARAGLLAARRKLGDQLATYLRLPFLPGEAALYAPLRKAVAGLGDAIDALQRASVLADEARARAAFRDRVSPALDRAYLAAEALVENDLDNADSRYRAIEDARSRASSTAASLGVGSLALAVVATLLALRSLTREAEIDRARTRDRALREVAEAEVRRHDAFLAVASHELRTPLTSLQLAAQLLARSREPSPRALDAIQRQVAQLTRVVDTLLDVTRIDMGPIPLVRGDLDLAEVARGVVARMAPALAAAGCVVSVTGDDEVWGRWDGTRVAQVVTNLVSNAATFGAGAPVTLRVERDGGTARLVVHDHGIGIAPDRVARIFERFERVESADHYGGLGLGLYITRHVVLAHGGRIDVRSEPGRGTTFVVELPRGSDALTVSPCPAAPAPRAEAP